MKRDGRLGDDGWDHEPSHLELHEAFPEESRERGFLKRIRIGWRLLQDMKRNMALLEHHRNAPGRSPNIFVIEFNDSKNTQAVIMRRVLWQKFFTVKVKVRDYPLPGNSANMEQAHWRQQDPTIHYSSDVTYSKPSPLKQLLVEKRARKVHTVPAR